MAGGRCGARFTSCDGPRTPDCGLKGGLGRAVSRILFPDLAARAGIIHLGGRYPEPGCFRSAGAGSAWVPYLALLPGRFSVPRRLRFGRWALTPPFHPDPGLSDGAVCFLWHCLSPETFVSSARGHAGLPGFAPGAAGFLGPAPWGVRTFLQWLAPPAIPHPSKTAPNLGRPRREGNGSISVPRGRTPWRAVADAARLPRSAIRGTCSPNPTRPRVPPSGHPCTGCSCRHPPPPGAPKNDRE